MNRKQIISDMTLFRSFPDLTDGVIRIKKMEEKNLSDLRELTGNPAVYRYCPYFLFQKSDGHLLAAIRNAGGRDFKKKKQIIAGIYLICEGEKLIGLAEMFDYKKRTNAMTIGYKINEAYWHRGLASRAIALMKAYLFTEGEVDLLHAYVMPENIFSEKALLGNGFKKLKAQVERRDWGGHDAVLTDHLICRNEESYPQR